MVDGQLAVKCFDCQISGKLAVKINKIKKKLAVKILEQIEPSNVLTARFLNNSQSKSTNLLKNSQ